MVRFTVDNRNRLIFYGNPVGYVKEDTAVVDEMFRTDELNQYLSRMNLMPRWEDGIFDRLVSGEVTGEEPVQPRKGCRIWQLKKDVDVAMRFIGYEDQVRKFGEPDAGNYTLVFDGEAVVGVKVTDEEGEKFIHATNCVILCAGGMEVNRAMMAKYSATTLQGIANIATPPNGTGECIRMGQGVGADLAGYDSTGAFDGGVWWRDYDEFDTEMDCHINKDGNQVVRQPWLRINRDGNRVPYIGTSARVYPYVNDASPSSEGLCETAAIEMSQPGGKTYCIFDSKYEQLMLDNYFGQVICRKGKILADDDPFYDRVPEYLRDWHTGFNDMVEAGVIRKCDTIEELEAALGLREGVLVDNVEKWNAACAAGEDYAATYKYPKEWLLALDEPPYYGAIVGGHVFGSKCGLKVNPDMQVISTEGAPIPGLYAAWHTAGGSAGEGNPAGKPLTGVFADLGLAFVGGYMAAGGVMKKDGRADA